MGEMSQKRFLANHKYRKALQRMKVSALRHYHDEVFRDSRWWIDIPKWVDRLLIERRLWFYRCAGNFHYKQGDPRASEFAQRAREFLSPEAMDTWSKEQQSKQRLTELHTFSKRNCKTMPIEEVDRYLSTIGLFLVDTKSGQRRRALFEFFNRSTVDIGPENGKASRKIRRLKSRKIKSSYVLRDVILKFPEMRFADFREKFGPVMPTVTRNSFKVTRCELRKAGYDLPKLATRKKGENYTEVD